MRSLRCVLWFALAGVTAGAASAPAPARAEDAKQAPARSPSIASLLESLKTEQASEARLQKEAEAAVRPNAALAAERRLYEQQLATRLAPIAAAIVADVARLQADVDKHNDGVRRSSAGCTGELPRPQWERCQGEKRHWDASKARLDARKDALEQRAVAYDREQQSYARRIAQLDAQIERNTRQAAEAQRARAEVQARIRKLQALLVDACEALQEQPDAPPEAIKHCGDVRWSGASPSAPALKRPRPPLVITPNR